MFTIKRMRAKSLAALCLCIFVICAFLSACAIAPVSPQAAPTPQITAAPVPTPEPTVDCGIPDLQYETEAYALQTLRARGVIAVIEYEENEELFPGLIESQSVEPGVCVQNGEPVTLKVAKAVVTPPPTPTPAPRAKKEKVEEAVPEVVSTPAVNVVYVDGIAVTPQPTWAPDKFEFDFDDAGSGYTPPCG